MKKDGDVSNIVSSNDDTMKVIVEELVNTVGGDSYIKGREEVIDNKGLCRQTSECDLSTNEYSLTETNLNRRLASYPKSAPDVEDTPGLHVTAVQSRRYKLLDKIRINSVNLANYHNHRYHVYKNILFTIFRVPLILLSGLNSFFAVGLQMYMHQHIISLITAIVSLFCGILTSIELLLNLQKRMEMEQETGKAYYRLSVEVYTELGKSVKDRGVDGDLRDFLKSKHNDYQNLFASANTVNMSERNFIDEFELYIEPENADSDNVVMETGTNYGDSHSPGYPHDSLSSDEHEVFRRSNPRISRTESSSMCSECCRNLTTSCLMTMFYCCMSSEQRIDRVTKKERRAKHKERKNKLGISRTTSHLEYFDFI